MTLCRVRVFDAAEYTTLLRRAARTTAKAERLSYPCVVDVALVSDYEMRKLNHSRRGIDKVTDVLSFPDNFPDLGTGRVFLGDVLLSLNLAKQQAEEYNHSLERELAYLTAHGTLHLLGYGHETEQEQALMREKEEYAMERMGIFR